MLSKYLQLNLIIVGLLTGCGTAGITRIQEDLEALKIRMQAREEVRIQVASADKSVTRTSMINEETDPHLMVAVPPFPPTVAPIVIKKQRPKLHKLKR